ncbi:tripartite tricarboxylate transporter substrate binding protein [Sporosarcina sp. P1]|uniref:Bug family tripartite tricarboxylate transporter substrate binding protein n=1 Tax=Sporosarcina sp. P1 TaxID=2048257 RepID=UPI000C164847|nr:tripartite tricarboxylate transporter substrate binding protein [Sporosarcina sp. P1]PIC82995.1 hypothetical protein CSV73_09730 [Sporosarcina sp. P1]
MKRNLLLLSLILLLIAGGCSNGAKGKAEAASDYPKKPIEIVVPFPPGGSTDVMARAIAKELPQYLPDKQQVAVINKPGAGTTLGLTEVAKAKPDGYTLGFTTSSGLDIQPHYGKTAYQIDSFAPIAKVYDIATAITVLDDSPLKTYDDWLAYVKENPGKFTYASPGGTGSSGHIAMEQLSKELGVETKHVPFEGVADLKNALMTGQIESAILSPDTETGGNIRPLLFTTDTKGPTDFYTDIPNTDDLGLEAKSDFYAGLIAPKDTPDEIIEIIHAGVKEILDSGKLDDIMKNQMLTGAYANPEEFKEIIQNASGKNETLMKEAGLIK